MCFFRFLPLAGDRKHIPQQAAEKRIKLAKSGRARLQETAEKLQILGGPALLSAALKVLLSTRALVCAGELVCGDVGGVSGQELAPAGRRDNSSALQREEKWEKERSPEGRPEFSRTHSTPRATETGFFRNLLWAPSGSSLPASHNSFQFTQRANAERQRLPFRCVTLSCQALAEPLHHRGLGSPDVIRKFFRMDISECRFTQLGCFGILPFIMGLRHAVRCAGVPAAPFLPHRCGTRILTILSLAIKSSIENPAMRDGMPGSRPKRRRIHELFFSAFCGDDSAIDLLAYSTGGRVRSALAISAMSNIKSAMLPQFHTRNQIGKNSTTGAGTEASGSDVNRSIRAARS